MSRKGPAIKRDVLPDPVYNSKVISKLINSIMLDGKKSIAIKLLDATFEEIKAKGPASLKITAKTERALRKNAMQQLFGNIKKSGSGNHKSKKSGQGDEATGEFRNFQFGDSIEQISITESLKNAQINHGIGEFKLSEEDLIIEDTHHKSQMSTVLMIDISQLV